MSAGTRRHRRLRGAPTTPPIRLLVLAALLATFSAPALHGQLSAAPQAPPASATAAPASPVGPLLVPGRTGSAPHDPATCPECAAIAQARSLLPKPAGTAPLAPAGRVCIRAPRALEEPAAAPVGSATRPRAPPRPSLAS
jgi:hypothetical protein